MKLYYAFGVVAILLLFLSGCSLNNSNNSQVNQMQSGFVGGSSGLVLRWYTPDEGYYSIVSGGQDEIVLDLEIENMGEADIPSGKGKVSLSGISPNDFGVSLSALTKTISQGLKGVAMVNGEKIDGERTVISFGPLSYKPSINTEVMMPVMARVCYPYETKAEALLCISKDPYHPRVCNPNGKRPVASSGAPIQVADFSQRYAGKEGNDYKFIITFKIKQVSNGEVFSSSSYSASKCDSQDFSSKDKVNVKIEASSSGDVTIKCDREGYWSNRAGPFSVRLSQGGEAAVRCTVKVKNSAIGDFVKVLPIELTYDYASTASTTIKILPSSSGGS